MKLKNIVMILAVIIGGAGVSPLQAENTVFEYQGKIGIGTPTPRNSLDIVGNKENISLLIQNKQASGEAGIVLLNDDQDAMPALSVVVMGKEHKTPHQAEINAYYGGMTFGTGESGEAFPRVVVTKKGFVGINTQNPTHELTVNGTIKSKDLLVIPDGWADFVFKPNYALDSLEKIEIFIKKNGHLPGIPSERDVLNNGVSLAKMQVALLQKVEELTLHMIRLNKENKELKELNEELINTLKGHK